MTAYIERPMPGTPASRRDRRLVFWLLAEMAEYRELGGACQERADDYKAAAWHSRGKLRTARLIAGDRLP